MSQDDGSRSWTDLIVGERMAVDQEFSRRIANSRFSSQEWSLIMTATEFEIESPEEPGAARIVADTSKVEHVLPELENVRSQMGAMGAQSVESTDSGGIFGALVRVLRGGRRDYAEERADAEALTQEYAEALQARLEENGRWEEVREAAT